MLTRVVALALGVTLSGGLLTVARGVPEGGLAALGRSGGVVSAAAPGPVPAVADPSAAAVSPQAPPAVAPLRTLRRADLVVTVRGSLRPEQAAALRRVSGVRGLTLMDAGTVQLAGRGARVVGVDPSQFRQFTPRETAGHDPLWASVARGEVVPTFGVLRERRLALGAPVRITGKQSVVERVGGVAAFGLPGVDLVTDRASARALGVVRDSAAVLEAPSRSLAGLRRDVRAVVGDGARVDVLRAPAVRASRGRPSSYRELYIRSARLCPGLRWTVLAAVGEVESGHGRSLGPSSAGALGPMQFMPATWAAYGVDGDGDGRADVMSPFDAVPAAALYLCRNGAGRGPEGLYNALFAYNRADWYVRKVLAAERRYR